MTNQEPSLFGDLCGIPLDVPVEMTWCPKAHLNYSTLHKGCYRVSYHGTVIGYIAFIHAKRMGLRFVDAESGLKVYNWEFTSQREPCEQCQIEAANPDNEQEFSARGKGSIADRLNGLLGEMVRTGGAVHLKKKYWRKL